jgi:hypothetical protein
MRNLLILLACFFTFQLSAQIETGSSSKRKMTKSVNYMVPYTTQGNIMFELAISPDGSISSVKVIGSESSIRSLKIESEFLIKLKKELEFNYDPSAPSFEHIKFNIKMYVSDELVNQEQKVIYPDGYDDVFESYIKEEGILLD